MTFNVKFWGVRGSVPSPLTPAQVTAKVKKAFEAAERGDSFDMLSFEDSSTYGGNTTCLEVRCGSELFILDMGTGLRELGKAQMGELMKTKALSGVVLQSHVHWDHIQGIPFWAPLYMPRDKFTVAFDFYGGKLWDSQLDLVYRGQMGAPYFPVDLQEIEQTALHMTVSSIYNGWTKTFRKPNDLADPGVIVTAKKLFHPQETFGYRIERESKILTWTTDHEPYALGIPANLMELVNDADVWITDVQYDMHQYLGKKGPQRMGWGHSFPEYVAQVAKEAKPKKIITTHHDPDADDLQVLSIARQVQDLCGIETIPAYEGLTCDLESV